MKHATQDALVNNKTGIGTDRDKGTAAMFRADRLDVHGSRVLYHASDLAERIVDLPADEMTRRGWEVKIPGDKTTAKKSNVILLDLKTESKLYEAIRKVRGFGGALVMVNVTDGVTDPREPINLARLQSVDSISVFEPGEATALEYVGNPADPHYQEAAKWQIAPRMVSTDAAVYDLFTKGVHPSRVFRIGPSPLSSSDLNFNYGFGESVLSRVRNVIARTDQNYLSAGALVDDFAQAVFKIRGLYKSMINDKGAGAKARLRLIDEYRSVLRGVVLDADGEDFVRQPTPLTGLPELIDRFTARLAAAANMPLSVLFGKSPSGLAASGDMDVRMWYDTIESAQARQLKPVLTWLLGLVFQSKKGPTRGKIPEDWEICFRALWKPTDKEAAETREIDARTRVAYASVGALDHEQIQTLIRDEWGLDADDNSEGADELESEEGTTAGVDPEGKPINAAKGAAVPTMGAAGAGENVQTQALNGAQVTSMIEIVKAVALGEISRESGAAILMRAFQVSAEEAASLLGPENFEPVEPEPPPSPFGGPPGGGLPGGKPPAKPGAQKPPKPPPGG